MCINYRGTEYHYGIIVENSPGSRSNRLNILMTNHRNDRPYIYGGICLDNGLQVCTNKRERHAAFYDIISKVADGATCIEKTNAERYPSQPHMPFKNILEEHPKLRDKFKHTMKKSLPLEKYKELRVRLIPLGKKQAFDPEAINKKSLNTVISSLTRKFLTPFIFLNLFFHYSVPVIYDCKDMVLALNTIQDDPQLNKSKINYSRV
jgi:hypothetical protein